MLILALDTSHKVASCAIMQDGALLAAESRDSMLDHSRILLQLVEDMLEKLHLSAKDIDIFAAVNGPGSFTGIRIGVAAVKGFAFTQDKPCAGVSSLFAMALSAPRDGHICAVIKAREGESYYAFFCKEGDKIRRLTEDAVAFDTDIEAMALGYGDCTFIKEGPTAVLAAKAAAQMAAEGRLVDCHALAPSYLRIPQAQRELEEKNANAAQKPQ